MRVTFGSYAFDSARCLLLRESEPVHLTRKAFLLLEMLIQRRPAVVSKQQILDALWPDCFVEEGSIASLVSEIRTGLDVGRGKQGGKDQAMTGVSHIRTVHGVGYAFAAQTDENGPTLRALPLGAPRAILIEKGPPPRSIELAEGTTTMGRGVDCDVRASSGTVSRNHARIHLQGGRATVEDLGSHNGTFVRGARIREPVALASGDELRLGSVEFVFRLETVPEGDTVSLTSERR
jgi:DNA-binding winged helix-turn-helix (wHTH) protein